MLPAGNIVGALYTQSSAPEGGRDLRPKHVELTGIINKRLLLHLVGVYISFMSMMHSQTNIKCSTTLQFSDTCNMCFRIT